MANPILQFSVLRPFQQRSKNLTRTPQVPSYAPAHNSQFFQQLKSLRAKKDREGMIARADAYRKSQDFVKTLHALKTPLEALGSWLAGRERQVSPTDLKKQVTAAFKAVPIADWKGWTKSAEYKTEVGRLSDSLVAASIPSDDSKMVSDVRPALVRALRLARLLERLAAGDKTVLVKDAVPTGMKAIVLLPKDVFPLPTEDTKKDRAKIIEAYKNTAKNVEEQRKQVLELVKELEALREAKAELNKLHRQIAKPEHESARQKRLTESQQQKIKPSGLGTFFGGGPGKILHKFTVEKDGYWALTKNATDQLSDPTKATLKKLGANSKTIDVRDATSEIDRRATALSQRLQATGPSGGVVKIGNTFVSKGLLTPVSKGPVIVRPAPGAVDVQVPVAPESSVAETGVPMGKGQTQPIGFEDLYVIRESLQKYLAGEVAHIENVLKGEEKKRVHTRTIEREQLTEIETEEVTETERDVQSTSRFELQVTSQEAVQQQLQAEADVEATYQPNPMFEVKASAGFAYDRATQESTSKASNVAHEVIDKAVRKTRELARERRVQIARETIKEINKHSLNNADNPQKHIRGLYRWVDKLYKVEVANIGRRLMFEFVIPEPAAFYKHAQLFTPIEGVTLDKPDPPMYHAAPLNPKAPLMFNLNFANPEPRPLQPEDLNESNYLHWVAKYNVQNVAPPPPAFKIVGTAINEKPQTSSNEVAQNIGEITVDDGYAAESAYVGGTIIPHQSGYLRVSVGKYVSEVRYTSPEVEMSGESGKIPITVIYYAIAAIGVTVEVTCRRTETKLREWQLKTFSAITNAYNNLKTLYNEQLAAAQTRAGVAISGRNPAQNRDLEATELKKSAIAVISGQHFDLFDAMRRDVGTHKYPQVDFKEAAAEGRYLQFFEQAFEWHNMSYFLYPYFWGRKDQWIDNLHLTDSDPKFEKFLRAGAARLLVPVRPGYEQAVLHYLETESGEIWEGGDPPHVDDELYVPMVDSIKESQGQFSVVGTGELAVKKDDAVVIGTGTAFTEEDDENREILIRGKVYRIQQVDDLNQSVQLERPYEDKDESEVPYELGTKFVGEPWEVKIPTSLVWLQDGPDLPDFTKP